MIYELFSISGLAYIPRSGRHRLAGKITVDGVPAKRRVAIINRKLFTLIAVTQSSSATGEWEIIGLPEYPENELTVIAFDSTGNYNAEVADYISQVATV